MNESIELFLKNYDNKVYENAQKLQDLLKSLLPGVTEQLELPAKMIAYCYGNKYADLICVIIPSKKGLKLGFNRGVELSDPENLLEGTGKISRYIVINSKEQIESIPIVNLIESAHNLYLKV